MGVAVCCERFHSSSLTNKVALPRKMSPSLETLLPYLVISRERTQNGGQRVARVGGSTEGPQQALGLSVYFSLKCLCLLENIPRAILQDPLAMQPRR